MFPFLNFGPEVADVLHTMLTRIETTYVRACFVLVLDLRHGTMRGNAQVLQGWKMNCVALDKRSWLEVRDKQHRYGKNLRLYYKVRGCLSPRLLL